MKGHISVHTIVCNYKLTGKLVKLLFLGSPSMTNFPFFLGG